MSAKKIDQVEIDKYWEIFASLLPPNTPSNAQYLTGDQAATILKNSGLRSSQLERVWDLADVDNDGRLDFVEFCVAMRLVFDLVNGEIGDVPQQLPDWLVPESKAHLVQAGRAMRGGGETFERPQDDEDEDEDGRRLKDGFDWYMAPAQKAEYEEIYTAARDGHGYVGFGALEGLYESLDVPDTDVRSAWNLVNPAADEVIGKDACMAYLHLLRGRHDGYRLPRTVPPSLRASFEKRDIDYNLERARTAAAARRDDNTSTGRKSKFGDTYLSRLGVGSDKAYSTKGTDFGTKTTADWEEVRLRKQLKELDAKIEKVEEVGRKKEAAGRRSDSKPALVKRELEQLLDYKRRELMELERGDDGSSKNKGLSGIAEEIATVKEQVDGLQAHLRKREEVLEDLKRQIAEEKGR